MPEAHTICITIPGITGETWVFIDPALPELAFMRQFGTRSEAVEYAQRLAISTGWPIEDAGRAGAQPMMPPSFDAQQARINELLLLMTAIVQDADLDWDNASFWADAARRQAQVILSVGQAMHNEDLADMLATGSAMLRLAAERLGLDSVDDVLARIMVVGGAS